MRTTGAVVTGGLAHRSTSPATDHAAVGLLVALGGTFLEADKLDHAESALQRAVLTVEAGGYASVGDTVMLHQRLAQIERRRRGQSIVGAVDDGTAHGSPDPARP